VVIVALVGTGMLLIGGAAHPIDADQLGPKAAPLMIVGTYALQQAVQTRVFRPWPLAGLTLLGAGLTARAVSHLIDVQITRPYVLEQHRAGKIWVFGPPSYLVDLAWLEANTVEGERVFLIPDKGGFNLLSRTRNATSYSSLLDGGFSTNAQVLDVTQQIARTCPAVGIWHRSRLNSFYDPRPEVATMLPLERVIFRDYEVVTEFSNGAVVMRRKPQGCSR
jgi:hypothetical protein